MADARDWDREMAEIDRLMKKQGITSDAPRQPDAPAGKAVAAPAPARAKAVAPAAAPSGPPALARGRTLQLWLMAALGPLGAAGLVAWPYARGCGAGLAVYLAGVAAVLAAGLVTMRAGWVTRRGLVLSVGLVTLFAALALGAREVLPRVGYAAEVLTWSCST